MSFIPRPTVVAVVAMAVAGGALLGSGGAARAATPPPWEPDSNSVGGLLFFDSAGHQITGGSTTASPLAAYVEGTSAIRKGDTKATLFAYTPLAGQAPGTWSGEALTASVAYPNPSAPAPLKTSTLPVVSGVAGDETIGDYVLDFPNNDSSSTDGYSGRYQIRLLTTAPGQTVTPTYDSADIAVTGTTWSVIYTKPPTIAKTKTTTTLAVTPAKAATHGAVVKLRATVSPASAKGVVQFRDGATLLASIPVVGGHAVYSTKKLKVGTHKLSARFVPKSTKLAASTSAVHVLKVKAPKKRK